VVLACGKEGSIYVIDTDTGQMGHFDPNQNHVYQQLTKVIHGMWGSPAYFNGTVYYGSVKSPIEAFQLQSNNILNPSPTSSSPEIFSYPGTTPDISADGSSSGIVWAINDQGFHFQKPAVLYAYDASNLGNELYNSTQQGSRDQANAAVKFAPPTIAN